MLKRLRTAHPILYCILSEVLFLGSMVLFSLLATIGLAAAGADFDTMDGYLLGSVQEAVGLAVALLLLARTGRLDLLHWRGCGFLNGMLVGMYPLFFIGYTTVGTLAFDRPDTPLLPLPRILTFMLNMILVGVAEELVFRGVLMRGLKPLGRNFAIVTSALMFGLFHDDVVQGLFAFGCGLLFGFVAMEYSLVWSIVLHVFNNAVLGGVLPWLAGLFGDAGDTAYTLGLLGVSIIGLIVVLVKYGGGLRAYRRVNRSAPGTYWGWTSPAFLIFVIVNVTITILSFVTAMMGV